MRAPTRPRPRGRAALAAAALVCALASPVPAGAAPGPDPLPGSAEGSGRDIGSVAIPGATGSAEPATDPFYRDIPAELGPPGTVLRTRPAPHLLQLAGLDWPGDATRIMYASTRQNGVRTPVTGVLIEPTVAWTGPGPRPTVVIAPGTMGQGDQCAPSAGYGLFANIDASGPSTAVNYELLNAYAAAQRGIRVVVTDYIGMGTPGVHTYVNSDDEGHAVLDAARAGLAAAGADPADPVGVLGYSQGGGAVAAAAERAGSYAPELNLQATYSGAPPADLREVLAGIDGNMIVGTIGYALNSGMVYLDEDVDVDELIERNLNEDGVRFLETTRGQCAVDSVLMWGRTRTAELTRDGSDFAAVLEREPAIAEVIDRQKLGGRAPDAPIRIVTGVNDDAIPTGQVRQLARDYCALGATVGFGEDDTPRLLPGSSLNHLVPMVRGLPAALDYLVGAFTGEEPANDCGSL